MDVLDCRQLVVFNAWYRHPAVEVEAVVTVLKHGLLGFELEEGLL